jgi:N-acetyltransferase
VPGGATFRTEQIRYAVPVVVPDHAGVADHGLWYATPVLTGHRVRLEPLTIEHAPGYLAAAGTPTQSAEIFRWQSPPGGALAAPVTVDDAARHVTAALAARARGQRFPYAQIDARTGGFAGTTSLADPDPVQRSVTIGYTWLGQRWWGTGVNVEAKLLLMAFAFETLGAVRVTWVTDVNNTRAQAAIERLGAVREGVLRKHRRRADGSWRDTILYAMLDDDWPAAKQALTARLDRHAHALLSSPPTATKSTTTTASSSHWPPVCGAGSSSTPPPSLQHDPVRGLQGGGAMAEVDHFDVNDAGRHLSRIIERVERGEEIVIDRAGVPVARVVPLVRRVNRTAVGSLAGQVDLSGDWDSPRTSAEIAADFGQRE